MNTLKPRLGRYFSSRRERGEEGLPTLSVTIDRGLIRRDNLDKRMETNLAAEEHLRVRPGDIAYNMMRMWQGAAGLADEEALVSPAYVVLAPNAEADSRFAAHLFKLPTMVHRFWAYSYGLTDDRLRLYPKDFEKIPWTFPPLPEQKKIADILSTWDAAIETTSKLLANAESQKRALMQQLLTGKRRLKGFDGKWNVVELTSLAEVIMGSSPPSSAYNETGNGLPLLQGNADLKNRMSAPRSYTDVITQECKAGDTLISVRAPVGTVALSQHHACIGRGLAAIRAKNPIDQNWLHQTFLSLEPTWAKISQGSTFEAVTSKEVRALKFRTPVDVVERQAIATVLSVQDKHVEVVRSRLECLRAEKRALMQQLLTGKRRVKL